MLLKIKNSRSIQSQEVELAPITVVYGANGEGKSSLWYALLTLKNAFLNSNSPTSGFFSYGFTSLDGFDAVVFDLVKSNKIELSLQVEVDGGTFEHGFVFGETQGEFSPRPSITEPEYRNRSSCDLSVSWQSPGDGSLSVE